MSRFSRLIDQLEDLEQQDLKNTAKVFSITAHLYERLKGLVETQDQTAASLPPSQVINQIQLTERYGNYDNAYQAYQKAYGIKCKRGWNYLLPMVKDLPIPETLEERVSRLEDTVQFLSEFLLQLTSQEKL